MFTGIIEEIGEVINCRKEKGNLHLAVKAKFLSEIKVDQSIAHNGVCLTVVAIENGFYTVTVIEESLRKSNLGDLEVGDAVNLERAMLMNTRLDGHIVQGHVDQVGVCEHIEAKDGSHLFTFSYDKGPKNVTIEKGSITINGTSLTVVDSELNQFSVAIIPYTFEHTVFKYLKKGDTVNLEFDVIGKYVKRLLELN